MNEINRNRKYISGVGSIGNLDDIGDYTFENEMDSYISGYVNDAVRSIEGSNDNIFSSSEYVKLEKDSYSENTYSLFEFDKLSVNLADYRASSASLYRYFNVLKPNSTYQLTTSEAISIDGLHFAIEEEGGVKKKTSLVKITNPENDGKHFVITTPIDKTTYFYGRFVPVFTTPTNLKVKLEIGYNPTPWTPSINDISNAILENSKVSEKNRDVLTDLKNSYYKFITTTFNDEVINIAELKSIEGYVNSINGTMESITASYDTIKDSPYLFNTNEKRDLLKKYSELVKAQDDLVETIRDIINDNKITPTGKDDINIAFDNFNQSIYKYQISYEKAKNLIDGGIYKEMLYEALGDGHLRMEIDASNFGIIIDDMLDIEIVATVFRFLKDVSSEVIKWEWSRDTGDVGNDNHWRELRKSDNGKRNITITGNDLSGDSTTFICEATVETFKIKTDITLTI